MPLEMNPACRVLSRLCKRVASTSFGNNRICSISSIRKCLVPVHLHSKPHKAPPHRAHSSRWSTSQIRCNSSIASLAPASGLPAPTSTEGDSSQATEAAEDEDEAVSDVDRAVQQPQDTRGPWRGSDVLAAIRQPAKLDPGLYIVATPIGNLEDITLRALRVLRDADCILAEDTRHSRKLLSYFGIATQLYSFHEHNEHAKEAQVLERLAQGASIALISDAGMPAVSDPGAKLIAAAVQARHTVVPIPGPSAVLASLVASGLPTDSFQFVGFLPPKSLQRQKRLQQLAGVEATLILYAPPHSLAAILDDMADVLGPLRQCVVAREMTKLHEEFHRGSLAAVATEMRSRGGKGEVTIVVEGSLGTEAATPSEAQIEAQLRGLIASGVSPSHAAKEAAKQLGVPRSSLYASAVRIKGEG